MSDTPLQSLLALAEARGGHFRLESGYHTDTWLELEALFVQPRRLRPFVAQLSALLAPFAPEVICGPLLGGALAAQSLAAELGCEMVFAERAADAGAGSLYAARYRLPPALRTKVRGKRVAIVDEAISAGSSVRATYDDLEALGAKTVAVGTFLALGDAAAPWFAARGIAFVACAQGPLALWPPQSCPLCAKGVALEEP